MKAKTIPITVFVIVCLGALFGGTPRAQAATCVVTNLNDGGPGSLRQCLASVTNGDTIDATGVSGIILLTSGALLFTNSVTILGPGPASLAIDGNAASRVIQISSNNVVTLGGLTVTNGVFTNSAFNGNGGGIINQGSTLVMRDCVIAGNLADNGGGIYSQTGSLTLSNTVIKANIVNRGGAGIYGFGASLTIANCAILTTI